jgi:hypothetical protein
MTADVSDLTQTINAVSAVVYLPVGLKYDLKAWQALWPRIMDNTIEACKRARAKLIFFDNVYMYGKVSGPMTEETPFNPCAQEGGSPRTDCHRPPGANEDRGSGRSHCAVRRFLWS